MVWLPVLVDSRDRDFATHPSAAAYVVRLPETMHNVRGIRLASAELPSSYYAFDDVRDRTLKLSVGNPNQTTSKTVVVARGSYSAMSMALALDAALTTAFGYAWFVAFSGTRCGFIIRPTTPTTDTVTIHASSFAACLGFSSRADVAQVGGLVGTGPCVLDPRTYVMLSLREGRGSGLMHTARSKRGVAKIAIKGTSNTYTFIADDERLDLAFEPRIPRLFELSLEFRFQDGTPVDFQGIEHALTLELDVDQVVTAPDLFGG